MDDVNPPRRYDASGRRSQADRNRAAILDEAERLLLSRGYAATTVKAIAKTAGMSVETVYKTFGGKSGLVRAIYDRWQSELILPSYHRSDERYAAETDPRQILRNWGRQTADVAMRFPILMLISSAAAADPEMLSLLKESQAERRARMERLAGFLVERGHARPDLTAHAVADILYAHFSPEFHQLLIVQCGWTLDEYASYLGDCLIAALLPTDDDGLQADRIVTVPALASGAAAPHVPRFSSEQA